MEQAALLVASGGRPGAGVGDEPGHEPDDHDRRPLQALGGVEGREGHRVVIGGEPVAAGDEPGPQRGPVGGRVLREEVLGRPDEGRGQRRPGIALAPPGDLAGALARVFGGPAAPAERVLEPCPERAGPRDRAQLDQRGGRGRIVDRPGSPAVGDSGLREGGGDRLQLGVGAGQHGDGAPATPGRTDVPDEGGDPGRLGVRVRERDGARRGTVRSAGHRAALAAPGEHGVAEADDLRRRAVAPAQVHDGRAGVVGGEVVEPAAVGSVPAVDGLLRVADDAQIGPAAPPGLQQRVLQRVHVLVLVDEQMPVPPAHGVRVGAVPGHLGDDQGEQVVEVDHPSLSLQRLVPLVEVGHLGRWERGASPGRRGGAGVRGRAELACPRPVDLARDLLRRTAPRRPAEVPQHLLDEAEPGDRERRGPPALVLPALPQESVRQAVERAGGDHVTRPEHPQAAPQLARGAPGEGDDQHVAGVGRPFPDAAGDAAGEHPGLAGARRRDDAERSAIREDGHPLLRIEVVQERIGRHRHTVDEHGHAPRRSLRSPACRIPRSC